MACPCAAPLLPSVFVRSLIEKRESLMSKIIFPFVVADANKAAHEALYDADAKKVLVTGSRGVGKSTMLKEYVDITNGVRTGESRLALLSNAAELSMAAFVKQNESLLERVGMMPNLVVDDIELFSKHEEGSDLIKLLVNARAKQGLRTILSTNLTAAEADELLPSLDLDDFVKVEMGLLGEGDYPAFAKASADFYGIQTSPVINDDAIDFIIGFAKDDLRTIENAVRFIVVTQKKDDYPDGVSAKDAEDLLTS